MQRRFGPRGVEPRRWVLALVLLPIGLALAAGGVQLIALGGSIYYAAAGVVLLICSYLSARGDARARGLYGLLLLGTLAWALWERGLGPWALQVRLAAPLVLGLWVFWPTLRQWPRSLGAIAGIAVLAVAWVGFGGADRDVKPAAASGQFASGRGDWLHYGNDLGGTRHSSLAQITPDNVGQLKQAWIMQTGAPTGMGFEATPLMVEDTLYFCTATSIVFALDADTGERRWTFDPKTNSPALTACRGVAYYAVPEATGPCAERIIVSTVDARLMAMDRRNGELCRDFGDNGTVDLKRGLGNVPTGYWRTSSAPEVIRGNIVLGGWVTDGQYVGEPSGVIRAFDAVTGKLAWAWDMERPDRRGEPPEGETYTPGTPNSWAPLSGDETLGLVFLPIGNSTPDYWGNHRSPASEKYGSSVVALDATTGELRWSFQTVHHDVWDYDVASQPTLVDIPINGQAVPALIQPTKRGQVFVLDRRTGEPLAPVEEKPVPQGPAMGDSLSPTQPYSTGMPSFDDTVLSERKMWGATPLDQLWCRIKFRGARYEGQFTPPGVKPTITYPSFLGGMNWGGVSVDPDRSLMVVNWNRMANYTVMVPREIVDKLGIKPSADGNMQDLGSPVPQVGTPFGLTTGAFWSPLMIPCTEPPFGKIAVVDLAKRQTVWERTLGTARDSGPRAHPIGLRLPMGVPNMGGSITTKSGLVFISATQERTIRAFDIRDGRKLWSARLPAGGQVTPMTYVSPRTKRQYVVIAAGGYLPMLSKVGDYVVAFALPE